MPRRNISTTPPQALNLLNSRFMLEQSIRFAERLRPEAVQDAERVRRGFFLAFGREPTASEQNSAGEVVREHGLDALCRALLNANEFLFVD
jgi:hypothetical protein